MNKLILLAAAAVVTLTSTAADAAIFLVGPHTYTVSQTGFYDIRAVGGSGGDGSVPPYSSGGFGADVSGRALLTAGSVLSIFVGDSGSNGWQNEGGGGGGTFVFLALPGGSTAPSTYTKENALIVAGGGGGGASRGETSGRNGGDATGIDTLASDGLGGSTGRGFAGGGGGAGVSGDGRPTSPDNAGYYIGRVGVGPVNGGGSGALGDGSGGLYGGGEAGAYGGGGGGGFSGGRGGTGNVVIGFVSDRPDYPIDNGQPVEADGKYGGAGGTSYLRADVVNRSFGLRYEHGNYGEFIINFSADQAAAVPEPASWAMMLVGFGLVGGAARYRRRSTKASFV